MDFAKRKTPGPPDLSDQPEFAEDLADAQLLWALNVRLTVADIEERVSIRVLALLLELKAGDAAKPLDDKPNASPPLQVTGGTTGRSLAQLIEEGTL